jgi:transcriptional regulator with XRE-family HTH domain
VYLYINSIFAQFQEQPTPFFNVCSNAQFWRYTFVNGELFVYKIWQLCKAKGLTKAEFYETAGITPAMALYKKGKTKPSMDTLRAIARVLEIDVSYLLTELYGDEKEKEPASQMESELDSALVKLLCSLTPTELAQVQGFAAALIAARKA